MELRNSMDYFYTKCAERVKDRIEQSGLSLRKIYSDDPKILSAIQNNRRTKKNPYLMCDRVFYGDTTTKGLQGLGFGIIQDVLWGTAAEINKYAKELFTIIFDDLLDNQSELDFSLEDILCDYVPYSKDLTYWNLLFSNRNSFPALFFGIREDTVLKNIDGDREKSLLYLYSKCKYKYIAALNSFTSETDTFTKIDKVFLNDFVYKRFIPILKKHILNETSLGLRVKNLIIADLSHVPELITKSKNINEQKYYRQLINASSEYILKLENIQADIMQNDVD